MVKFEKCHDSHEGQMLTHDEAIREVFLFPSYLRKTSANCKLWDCLFFPTQLCHINNQWALDYKSLTQIMSANSTGNYSIPSCSSSHHHISVCTRCPQLERQLEESNSEVCQLTAKLEKPQRTIEQKSQEVENENWCQVGPSEM